MWEKTKLQYQDRIPQRNSSQIAIFKQITDKTIRMEVCSEIKQKCKSYIIHIQQHSEEVIQKIVNFIKRYSTIKMEIVSPLCQIHLSLLDRLQFDEVICAPFLTQNQLLKVYQKPFKKISFNGTKTVDDLVQIDKYSNIVHQKNYLNIQFVLHEQPLNHILQFIMQVIARKPNYQFQYYKISILSFKKQVLFSFEFKQPYGYFLLLNQKQISNNTILQVLQKLCTLQAPISVQILYWKPSYIDTIIYILQVFNFPLSYLIKLSNFIEITNSQFLINTTGMTSKQVKSIYILLQNPGHYEIICHSSSEYFHYAIQLFMKKPIIKFKYLVPFDQYASIGEAIQSMESYSQNLLERIKVFMKMNNHQEVDFDLALKLYSALSVSYCSKNAL